MKKLSCFTAAIYLLAALTSGCSSRDNNTALPSPAVDENSMFGVDTNINMDTIDSYLGRDDVEYIDTRMLFDPADYEAIDGEADLTRTITGFKIVPYPYIATLSELPVSGAYKDNCLYTIIWNNEGGIESATPNYMESDMIITELFPKDKVIFLMCGGGGYSGMMKSLLIFLGWDENLLYNIGGNWTYTGNNTMELIVYPEDAGGESIYATWRADYAYIDFSRLHPILR